jgi:DNA-binding MarR family transcriptional regulator
VAVSRYVIRKGHDTVNQAGPGGESAARRGDNCLAEVLARLQRETPLWQHFLAAHQRIIGRMAAQMMADHQLPLEWFDVLIHLADMPDMRLRQRVLRDRLLLSESGVSRMLVRMEQAGLVTRTTADEDRRGLEIALTEHGQAALSAATASHLQLVADLFTDRLTASDRLALDYILSKLLAEPGPARAHDGS